MRWLLCVALTCFTLVYCGGGLAVQDSSAAPRTQQQSAQAKLPPGKGKLRVDFYGDPLPDGAVARMGTTRLWHEFGITAFALSPDGKTLAAAGATDKTIHFWDANTGQALSQTEAKHHDDILSLAYSPDNKTVASAGKDRSVRVWDVASGIQKCVIDGNKDVVNTVVYSPDGRALAFAVADGTVILAEAASGKPRLTFKANAPYHIVSLAFSPDGKLLASADNTIRIWDVQTGTMLRFGQIESKAVQNIKFSLDGKSLAAGGSDYAVRLLDVATGKEKFVLLDQQPQFGSSRRTEFIKGVALAFAPDGKTLASGGRTLRLWEVASGKQLQAIDGNFGVALAYSPDGKKLISTGGDGRQLTVWDLEKSKELLKFTKHADWIRAVAFAPDGKTVASGADDRSVRIWDATTGKALNVLEGHTGQLHCVAFSPDGKSLASAAWDNTVRLWDTGTGKERLMFEGHNKWVNAVTFSPDGKTVASGGLDGMRLWDAASSKELRHFDAKSVRALDFSPDGKFLICVTGAGGFNDTLQLWDIATGKEVRTFNGIQNSIESVKISPDGKTAVTGSRTKLVTLWDVASGQERLSWDGNQGNVLGVAFAPDGKTVASAGADNVVRLWSAATGKELQTFQGHRSFAFSVAFSPDGKRLASSSGDTTILIWQIAP